MFNPLIPGTYDNPIYIKMPATDVGLKATYITSYKLNLTNATIDDTGESSGFYVYLRQANDQTTRNSC